jgi:hypothetical protein
LLDSVNVFERLLARQTEFVRAFPEACEDSFHRRAAQAALPIGAADLHSGGSIKFRPTLEKARGIFHTRSVFGFSVCAEPLQFPERPAVGFRADLIFNLVKARKFAVFVPGLNAGQLNNKEALHRVVPFGVRRIKLRACRQTHRGEQTNLSQLP